MNTITGTPPYSPWQGAGTSLSAQISPSQDEEQIALPSPDIAASLPRKFLERSGEFLGGAIEAAISVPAGFAGGIVEGIDERSGMAAYSAASVLELGVSGAVAGNTVLGIPGAIVGGIGGLAAGVARLGVHTECGAFKKMEEKLQNSVKRAISDNVPSGKKARDFARNATEASVIGALVEGREGWKIGLHEGRGLVDGVTEGIKGIAGMVTGTIGPQKPDGRNEPAAQSPPGTSGGNSLMSIPRVILGTTAGILSGLLAAAITIPVGNIQGLYEGALQKFDGVSEGFDGFHRFMAFAQLTAAGGVSGFMAGGPLGLGIGLGAGIASGLLAHKIEIRSGADKIIVGNISHTLQDAAADNPKTDSPIHDTFRDSVEGSIVGTAAGVKEGFKKGYEGGIGAVDGVIEGVKGFFGAIGDISGKKK